MSEIIDTTENCRYCLMCRHMCPVGNVTHNESLTPHGWGLMVAGERRGLIEWDRHAVDALYKCADCGSCESHCVTDQPLPNAIAEARSQLVEKGIAPDAVKKLSEQLNATPNLYNGRQPESPAGKGEVALFVGDEADHFAPGTVDAVLKLLDACGIQPVLVGRGRNDGLIPSGLGLQSQAVALAKATVNDLDTTGATTLLVLSPGAYFTFNRIYSERMGVAFENNVKIVEVLSLLAQKLNAGDLKFRKKPVENLFAYIDPTHSVRVKERYDVPRNLMDKILEGQRVELFWRKERSGAAGNLGLQFTHPELADKLTKSRLEEAVQAGAGTVYTEDPGTYGHLRKHADDYGIKVQNLYEVIAEQL